MTDEALERLEKNVSRRNELKMEWTTCYTHDASALLASYRALQSENREFNRVSTDFELWWKEVFGEPTNTAQSMVKSTAYHAWRAGRSQSEAAHTKEVMLHAVTKFELGKAESENRIAMRALEMAICEYVSVGDKGKFYYIEMWLAEARAQEKL